MKLQATIPLLLTACAVNSALPEKLNEYIMRVVNKDFEVLVIQELPVGRKRISVYPGETREWKMDRSSQPRALLVRAGARTYLSATFEPSETFPCWQLVVDRPPNLAVPTGPVPCDRQQ
ncbi:MAG: hypothetical protein KatS3mg109_2080 [Pirellulaceae bacterium]|nr:MAG: hypothetical protein KatS3mg109_0377 [Pirellulaceae bacterium]GIW91548.1 MAG: hypothetical protein KatS3mg109_1980 [Pirellulaceae bacterium]GIW91648.1 MAG: hypothetical protein KatS3mg109_2080 [Pirellulaceae bacterium]